MANVLQAKETRTHLVCVSWVHHSKANIHNGIDATWHGQLVTSLKALMKQYLLTCTQHFSSYVCLFGAVLQKCCACIGMTWNSLIRQFLKNLVYCDMKNILTETELLRSLNSFQVSNRGKHFKTTTDLSHGWCLKRWRKHALSQVFETWYWDQIQN